MAAGKIFAISFAINAVMGASFSSAMSRGTAAMQQLKSQAGYLRAEQSRLNRIWQSAGMSIEDYREHLQRLKKEAKDLTRTARELGATTQFSATQSAEAMTYLGMAGWDSQKIIAGMPGLLNLAAASGEDLARTADIVSDGLTAFGMDAGRATEMADVMAAASSSANTNVYLMGETFKYCAPVAGALGYSMQDTTLAIGLMANAGIKGSAAGTALRSTMTRLVKPPKEAAEALEQLGISAVNSDGTMKPFRVTVSELREKFAGLSEAEKAAKAASIAGQEAMSGFLAIMTASEKDVNSLAEAIDNSNGKAAEMAKTMTNNAQGAIIQLKSAVESLSISIGTVFLPYVSNAAQAAASMASEATVWAEDNEAVIKSVGEIGVAAASAAIAVKSYKVAGSAFSYARASAELYLETMRYTTTGQKALTVVTKAQTKAMLILRTVINGDTYRQFGTQAMSAFQKMRA